MPPTLQMAFGSPCVAASSPYPQGVGQGVSLSPPRALWPWYLAYWACRDEQAMTTVLQEVTMFFSLVWMLIRWLEAGQRVQCWGAQWREYEGSGQLPS